jgi:chromosome segregation ATPase
MSNLFSFLNPVNGRSESGRRSSTDMGGDILPATRGEIGLEHESFLGDLNTIDDALSQAMKAKKSLEEVRRSAADIFRKYSTVCVELETSNALLAQRMEQLKQAKERETLLIDQNVEIGRRISELQMQIDSLEESDRSQREKLISLRNELSFATAEVSQLEKLNSDMSKQVRMLTEDVEQARSATEEQIDKVLNLQNIIKIHEETIKAQENEKLTLEHSMQETVRELNRVRIRVTDAEVYANNARSSVAELERQVSILSSDKAKLQAAYDRLFTESNQEKASLTQALEATRSRADVAQKLLSQSRDEALNLSKQTSALDRKVGDLTIEMRRLQEINEQRVANITKLENENNNINQARSALAERLDLTMQTLNQREKANLRLEKQVEELQSKLRELNGEIDRNLREYESKVAELSLALEKEKSNRSLLDVLERALDDARTGEGSAEDQARRELAAATETVRKSRRGKTQSADAPAAIASSSSETAS